MTEVFEAAQFLWVEGSLSTMEQLCLNSFIKNNYEVHLYTYKPVAGIPREVKVIPAQDILSEEYIVKSQAIGGKISSYTAAADLFRLELLFQRGGWWFDMDMICLRHLPRPSQLRVASTWEGRYGECACNCAIWAERGDSHIEELRDKARLLVKNKGSSLSFGEAGIFLLQQLIRDHGLHSHVAPWWEFCPYPWRLIHRLAQRNIKAFVVDQLRAIKHRSLQVTDPSFKAAYVRSGSRTLHFHNEIWKASGLGKDEAYFPLSPIEGYKRQYLA